MDAHKGISSDDKTKEEKSKEQKEKEVHLENHRKMMQHANMTKTMWGKARS